MKRNIELCGIGHKAGTNRQGKNYDFYEAHFTYVDSTIEGIGCGNIIVPDEEVSVLAPGSRYELHTHYYNGREYFDAIFISDKN